MAKNDGGCGCACGGRPCGETKTAAVVMKTDARRRWRDRLGTVRVRLGIRRGAYRVTPGLYALGAPGPRSGVFVSANYKLSFDALRTSLAGLDAWILVLDTRGVNVWCAAGKGTFGTEELIAKIGETRLDALLETRELVLPQLGAPGVAAHEVERATGFKVVWGPVRAADLKVFLANEKNADPEMRRVRFNVVDRAKLVFVEFAGSLKYLLPGAAVVMLAALAWNGFRFGEALAAAAVNLAGLAVVLVAGTIFTPLLLPWLPGRSFSLKGLVMGLLSGLLFALFAGQGAWGLAAWTLAGGAAGSFFAMGFTGASTYTSLSGTVKEMRRYVPVQIAAAAGSLGCFILPAILSAVQV